MASRNRKHLDEEYYADQMPTDEQVIGKVTELRGGNLIEVMYPSGERTLCLIPTKFRKKVWIRRGWLLFIYIYFCKQKKKHLYYCCVAQINLHSQALRDTCLGGRTTFAHTNTHAYDVSPITQEAM